MTHKTNTDVAKGLIQGLPATKKVDLVSELHHLYGIPNDTLIEALFSLRSGVTNIYSETYKAHLEYMLGEAEGDPVRTDRAEVAFNALLHAVIIKEVGYIEQVIPHLTNSVLIYNQYAGYMEVVYSALLGIPDNDVFNEEQSNLLKRLTKAGVEWDDVMFIDKYNYTLQAQELCLGAPVSSLIRYFDSGKSPELKPLWLDFII